MALYSDFLELEKENNQKRPLVDKTIEFFNMVPFYTPSVALVSRSKIKFCGWSLLWSVVRVFKSLCLA